MDIHKPKPWRGLRGFLKEYAIIFVGVLTALAAEQSVGWLHERAEVAEAREALKREIAANAGYARFSIEMEHCQAALLDRDLAWANGGPHPPVVFRSLGRPRTNTWD